MSEIDDALNALATLIKTVNVTNPPDGRVWVHPNEGPAISRDAFPMVIVSKMNTEAGSWEADSFGAGKHKWDILIAVYISEGPITATNANEITLEALTNSTEWYKAISDILFANMTLSGTVDIIGDADGKLFDYITDNIVWEAQQHFGHLFVVPVTQSVVQGVSA